MQIIPSGTVQTLKRGRRPDCLERKHHMAFPEKETGGGISQLGGYTQPAENYFRGTMADGLYENHTQQIGSYFIVSVKYRFNQPLHK